MSHADEQQIMAKWRELWHRVNEISDEIGTDPLKAMEKGITVSFSRSGLPAGPSFAHTQIGATDITTDREAVMRAVAQSLIPKTFEWDVVAGMGGVCFLTLKGYKPEHE